MTVTWTGHTESGRETSPSVTYAVKYCDAVRLFRVGCQPPARLFQTRKSCPDETSRCGEKLMSHGRPKRGTGNRSPNLGGRWFRGRNTRFSSAGHHAGRKRFQPTCCGAGYFESRDRRRLAVRGTSSLGLGPASGSVRRGADVSSRVRSIFRCRRPKG